MNDLFLLAVIFDIICIIVFICHWIDVFRDKRYLKSKKNFFIHNNINPYTHEELKLSKYSKYLPKSFSINDCFICSIAKYLNISWEEAYHRIADCGLRHGLNMTAHTNVIAFLVDNKWKNVYILHKKDKKYSTLKMLKQYNKGKYIFLLNGHAIYVRDGKIYDCNNNYDYRESIVYSIWTTH